MEKVLALQGFSALPGSIPLPPQPEYIQLGPFQIHYYALCILAGIAVAYWMTLRRYQARGGDGEVVSDLAMWAVGTGVVGARLGAVITYPSLYFGEGKNPLHILYIWEGGLAIYGGIIGGLLGLVYALKKRGLAVGPFIDAVAPGVLVAQGIGRVGNWFNQEVFGSATTLPWGLQIDAAHLPAGAAEGTLFHPTFLYEMLWNFAGAAALIWWEKRRGQRMQMWEMTGGYLIVYAIGRGLIEIIRTDYSLYLFGTIRLFVAVSVVTFLVGLALVRWARRTQTGPSRVEPGVAGGAGEAAEAGAPDTPVEDTGESAENGTTAGKMAHPGEVL